MKRAILILAVLAAAIPASASAQQSARGFTWAGTCTEPIFTTYIDTAVADKYVPDRFEVKESAPGKVLFGVTAGDCHDFSVNGAPHGSYRFSEAVVQIEPPDGSQPLGTHFYNLWQVVDSATLRAQWTSLGTYGARVDALAVETDVGALASTGEVVVPWEGAPHRLTVETGGPQTPIGNSDFDPEGGNGWHLGPHGRVQIDFSLGSYSPSQPRWAQAGTATLEAPAGSPVAELLGAEEGRGAKATGAGIITRFSFDGRARLLPSG
jgi:hypothetical protein